MPKKLILFIIVTFFAVVANAQQKIVLPEFPEGKKALKEYLNQELNKIQLLDGIQGQAVVTLLVEVDIEGKIQNPTIGMGVNPTLDSIALAITTAMPKWTPGSIDGKSANMKTTLSIPFMPKRGRLPDDKPQIRIADVKGTDDLETSIADVRGVDGDVQEVVSKEVELKPIKIIDTETREEKSISIAEFEEAFENGQIAISVLEEEDDEEYGIDIADLKEYEMIEEKPFNNVEQMPSFAGGEAEMRKFLARNLVYPTEASEAGIQGRVTLRFIVEKDGSLSNVQVQRGLDPYCDKEAVRVVKAMPKWNPGKQNGEAVPVYFTLPLVFRLE